MSIDGLTNDIIDRLYVKYGFLDRDGFLIGTSHPIFLNIQDRIEQLSKKEELTNEEEREGTELIIIQKSYIKELNNYALDNCLKQLDESKESTDEDFEPDEPGESGDSDESGESGESGELVSDNFSCESSGEDINV